MAFVPLLIEAVVTLADLKWGMQGKAGDFAAICKEGLRKV
jgi:hypothetical protein